MTPLTANDVRRFLLNRFSARLTANGINPSDVGDNYDLIEAGIVDSLGLLEMIAAVEEHFNITVYFESMDPAQLPVVGVFSGIVAQNAANKAASPPTGRA